MGIGSEHIAATTRSEDDLGRSQYPDKSDSRSNKKHPGLVRQSYYEKKYKGIGD